MFLENHNLKNVSQEIWEKVFPYYSYNSIKANLNNYSTNKERRFIKNLTGTL